VKVVLLGKLGRDEHSRATRFLSSEMGKSLLMASLSMGVSLATMGRSNDGREHLNALSQELRVGALAIAGDELVDLVMAPVRDVLASFVNGEDAGASTTLLLGENARLEVAGDRPSVERLENA
jgi:hypothetical protein